MNYFHQARFCIPFCKYVYFDDYLIKMYSSWPFYFDISRKTKQKQTKTLLYFNCKFAGDVTTPQNCPASFLASHWLQTTKSRIRRYRANMFYSLKIVSCQFQGMNCARKLDRAKYANHKAKTLFFYFEKYKKESENNCSNLFHVLFIGQIGLLL